MIKQMNLMRPLFSFVLTVSCLVAIGFAADGSMLKPPPGAKVAVVVFEDLECPSCAHAYPLIWQAANAAGVPVVLHDFPLSKHPWALDAAVYARFFDTKSQKLGNDFRGFIYQNQPQVTPMNLRQFVQKFADENKVPVPFIVDPDGKLKEKIQADQALGQQTNLSETPTIFVIGEGVSPSFVQVTDPDKLAAAIEEMQKKAAAPSASSRSTGKKKSH
jgi:protein-disulfide isomerase